MDTMKILAVTDEIVERLYFLASSGHFWQTTRHPIGLVTEKVFEQKVNYIHWNPCRKGLVRQPEDWRFSSASFWMKGVVKNRPLAKVYLES
jgi:REP element-mobilizing transposase RayT